MKARLKESQLVTLLSDMEEGQFAVMLDGNHIVYRPSSITGIFAIDLTDGYIWNVPPQSRNLKTSIELRDFRVRILQAGEVIEITE